MKQGEFIRDRFGHWEAAPGASSGELIRIDDVGRLMPALVATLNLLEEILKEMRAANARNQWRKP